MTDNSLKKFLPGLLIAIIYFVTARLGLMLAYPGTNATPLWLPTGIAISALLLLGSRVWPGIALAAFFANLWQLSGLGLSIPASFAASLSTSAGNTLEGLTAAYLIRRFIGEHNPFLKSRDVLLFILFGALVSTTISATVGVTVFCLSISDWSNFASIWLTWWLGDATGAIVVVPLALTYSGFRSSGNAFRQFATNIFMWAITGAICYLIFDRGIHLSFILFPVVIIAALRLGQFSSAMAVGIVSVISTHITVNYPDRLAAMTLTEALLLQQGFIGSLATVSVVLSAVLSEQRRSKLEVSESEARLKALISQSPIGIALSRENIILDANRVCLDMFGFRDITEIQGTSLSDRMSHYNGHAVLERADGQRDEVSAKSEFETLGVHKNGTRFPLYVSIAEIALSEEILTVSFFIDITGRRQAEDALQTSERKYRELVMNANSIILRWNSEGGITFMNEYGLRFFGYSETEIVGHHVIGTIVSETDSSGQDMRALMDQICLNPAAFEQNINENVRHNGEHVWINWTNKVVLDDKGKIKEILSIGSDITRLKQAEEELKKHREQLEQLISLRTADLHKSQLALMNMVEDLNSRKEELLSANDRLKEFDRLKSMFIASMSHELRTPLNSIIGFTGMTLQGLSGELNDEQRDNLSRSYQAAKHLLSLITDVIDISKIEAGRIEPYVERTDLAGIINEATISIEPMLKEKGLTLKLCIPSKIQISTDKKRLLQCLINLMSNAVKYTENGGITVSVLEEGSYAEIAVSDTGIGISEDDLPKLFEAFERLETHLRVKVGGTGLGLYLTKKLATEILHGGINVKSRVGQGSTFTLRLPKNFESDQTKGEDK